MATGLLEVRSLRKTFGGVVANDDISMSVAAGSIVGLIGPNGSGKTTLFSSIVGYHAPDAGSVYFDGRSLVGLDTARIARLGLVRTFQQAHVYDGLSCVRNMQASVPRALEGIGTLMREPARESAERAHALLELIGLSDKREVVAGELSYGQRKLLEFGMALMGEPKMMLLDEPTAGINPTLINWTVDRLRHAASALGITLMIIEHNMRVIMNLAEHIYCLAHGRLLAEGSPCEIRNDARVVDAYLGRR